jgi:hypothetical protein
MFTYTLSTDTCTDRAHRRGSRAVARTQSTCLLLTYAHVCASCNTHRDSTHVNMFCHWKRAHMCTENHNKREGTGKPVERRSECRATRHPHTNSEVYVNGHTSELEYQGPIPIWIVGGGGGACLARLLLPPVLHAGRGLNVGRPGGGSHLANPHEHLVLVV